MNRYLTLSAVLHGVLLGGLAIWGADHIEADAPAILRVRLLDERGAAAGSPDEAAARAEARAPERPVEAPPPAPRRVTAPRTARASIPPPLASLRETEPRAGDAPASAGAASPVAARASPGARPGHEGGAAAERDDRIAEIHARIQRALLYPREARRRGVEGTVRLRFEIGEDGRVRRVAVRESSGERLLDRASIQTVRRAQPFPFVEGRLEVPVVFRLE